MLSVTGLMSAADAAGVAPFHERLLLSPMAGGLFVVVAALIAAAAARRSSDKQSTDARTTIGDERKKADREQRAVARRDQLEREKARQDRFWFTLTWIYDRATRDPMSTRLSPAVTLDLLDALADEAETDLEVKVVTRIISITAEREAGGGSA